MANIGKSVKLGVFKLNMESVQRSIIYSQP